VAAPDVIRIHSACSRRSSSAALGLFRWPSGQRWIRGFVAVNGGCGPNQFPAQHVGLSAGLVLLRWTTLPPWPFYWLTIKVSQLRAMHNNYNPFNFRRLLCWQYHRSFGVTCVRWPLAFWVLSFLFSVFLLPLAGFVRQSVESRNAKYLIRFHRNDQIHGIFA